MTRQLRRIDPETLILQELDQVAIRRTAHALIAEILKIPPEEDHFDLHNTLLPYAKRGLDGEITKPVDEEPLQYETLNGELPLDVGNKYASFSFYTNGLTSDYPELVYQHDKAYAWVDMEDDSE